MNIDPISRAYRSTAVVGFTVIAAFVALNFMVDYAPYLESMLRSGNRVAQKYGEAPLLKVYPGKSAAEINGLLAETWSRPYAYEAFTQFKEQPFQGRYVNVDASGFRASANQAAWPPRQGEASVFVFGGSTTFGYGVADAETVPSYLQDELRARLQARVSVYNFGRGFYYSTQERILFEQLLAGGHVPDVAIFIDGLNEFSYPSDEPQFTPRLKALFGSVSSVRSVVSWSKLPAIRAVKGLVRSVRAPSADTAQAPAARAGTDQASAGVTSIVARYLANKKLIEAIARGYGVKAIFVWQPVPLYKYDLASHLFAAPADSPGVAEGYEAMAARRLREDLGADFLWCADIQEGRREPLYVDRVHYTAAFSKATAACIAGLIKERELLAPQ